MTDTLSGSAPQKKERAVGVELLRVLCMFLIACQHTMNHGGFLSNAGGNILWLRILHTLFSPSVNVFVLITGYFSVTSTFKVKKVLSLWGQVLFYSLFMLLIGTFFDINPNEATVIHAFFPVTYKAYWFFSAYLLLYLFMPFLNLMLNQLARRQFTFLVIGIFVLAFLSSRFAIGSVISHANGFSFIWFCALYCIGAYLRKYPVRIPKPILLTVYAACMTLLVVFFYRWNDKNVFLFKLLYNSTDYTQPLVLIAAVCLLLLFLGIDFHSRPIRRVILYLSSMTFGVYLFHETGPFRSTLYKKILRVETHWGAPNAILYVLLDAVLIFAVGTLIETFRQLAGRGLKKGFDALKERVKSEKETQ